jgi:hypothetical protein
VKQLNLRGAVCQILAVNIVILSALFYIPEQGGSEDIILSDYEYETITGSVICENLTISGGATLVVDNAFLRINGLIRMSGKARLFVIDSTLRLSPPSLNDSTIVVHIIDSATIYAQEGSNIIFEPQPTATNISYMLLEDQSRFYLLDSTFSGELPPIINQSIVTASVTAGVYLLSGYASWYIKNSEVTGRISFDGMEQTGRWFWCSLHQRSTLTIENTDIQLLNPGSLPKTLLKPVSGTLNIKNSKILRGLVDGEVTSEFYAESSSFNSQVNFKDQTTATISNCTFYEDVTVGLALDLTISSALGEFEVSQAPETIVEFENATFNEKLECNGNSTTLLKGSTLVDLDVNDNSSVEIVDSSIEDITKLSHFTRTSAKNSFIKEIRMHDTALVSYEGEHEISTFIIYGSGKGSKNKGSSFSKSKINYIQLQSDISDPIDIKNVTIFLEFVEMTIGNLTFYNEVDATFECINSSIQNYKPWRSGENVTLSFIDVNSNISDLTILDRNITSRIYHRLEILSELNESPIEAEVKVTSDYESKWTGTSSSGKIVFDLPYKHINNDIVNKTENYILSASYLGLSDIQYVHLNTSKTVFIQWVDESPPEILNIEATPKQWNLGREITVKASVMDSGVMSIREVTLFYRFENGDWQELEMFRIADNLYETTIPEQNEVGEITFYIEAVDMANNTAKLNEQYISVGQEENLLIYTGVILILCLIFLALILKIIHYRKIKQYTTKYEFKKVRR